MNNISFNVPPYVGNEEKYIKQTIARRKISGDGEFTKKCNSFLEKMTGSKKALITTSGTAALEMTSILADIEPGDEVIMPSYTFVSTANAFALRGAKIVFVDIRPDTMNIDEKLIEDAVTEKTKAIVPVHYGGVGCEMDTICDIAKRHNLFVIEDAAQGVNAFYKGKALGSIGDFGCFSFHETKNYSCGEGGAILINNEKDIERAEIVIEKGTNRSKFFRGQVDKYTWVDIGSSYLQSELNCAYLCAQIENPEIINNDRTRSWNLYNELLAPLKEKGFIETPYIPDECTHNAHMYYIKVKNLAERTKLLAHMKNNDVLAVFHYIPLHSSPAGRKFGTFFGEDKYTTKESERIVRLPMYYGLKSDEIEYIVKKIEGFFEKR